MMIFPGGYKAVAGGNGLVAGGGLVVAEPENLAIFSKSTIKSNCSR